MVATNGVPDRSNDLPRSGRPVGGRFAIPGKLFTIGVVALLVVGATGCGSSTEVNEVSEGNGGDSERSQSGWVDDCIETKISVHNQQTGRRFSSDEKKDTEETCSCMHDYIVETTDPPFPLMSSFESSNPAVVQGFTKGQTARMVDGMAGPSRMNDIDLFFSAETECLFK